MDATVATGAASMMAIRVLLDHDVPEENIMLCSLLMAESGNQSVRSKKKLFHLQDCRTTEDYDFEYVLQTTI